MKLIVAQGNPGTAYTATRHNVGFAMLDDYAAAHDATWAAKPKFHAYIAELTIAGQKVLLVKPTTYYNETGQAVRTLMDFYKLASSDILVLHDDMALPLGTIRTRERGSDAGNNGIKSLNTHLGQAYSRARIGIWSDRAEHMDNTSFVLGKLTAKEQQTLAELQPIITSIIDTFIAGSFVATSHR